VGQYVVAFRRIVLIRRFDSFRTGDVTMRILAIDVGKRKSVACDYNSATADHKFKTVATTKQALHDLLVETTPERVVIEVGLSSGWIVDLCGVLGLPIAVANPSHEAWRWKNVKTKTDRTDALKLAKLSAAEQLPTVHVPSAAVRQWRSLIGYRHKLVRARIRAKNSIRAILMAQGESLIGGRGRGLFSLDKTAS
jgi:transposase